MGSQGWELKGTKNKIKRSSVPRLQPRSRRRYRDSRQNLRTSASDTVSCVTRHCAIITNISRLAAKPAHISFRHCILCYAALRNYYKHIATRGKTCAPQLPTLYPVLRGIAQLLQTYRDSRQNLRTSASDTVSCYIRGIAHLLQRYRDSRQNLRTSASDTVSCYTRHCALG